MENIDDLSYQIAITPTEVINDSCFTEEIIGHLVTLAHTKDNPIFAAAKLGTPNALKWLQEFLKDPGNMFCASHELLIACENNDLAVINILLQAGVDPNIEMANTTPLIIAAREGHNKTLARLIEAGANNFWIGDEIAQSVAHIAAQCDNHEALKILLDAGLDHGKHMGNEILDYSTNKKRMKLFLQQHGYTDLKEIDHNQYGYAIGYWPLGIESLKLIKTRIEHVMMNDYNITFMQERLYVSAYVIYANHGEELSWLIEQFTRCAHSKDNIIYAAARLGIKHGPVREPYYLIDTGIKEWLTAYLSDPFHMQQAEQELIIAAGNNDTVVIESLLATGVSPQAQTSNGLSALKNAINRQAYQAIELLIKAGSAF